MKIVSVLSSVIMPFMDTKKIENFLVYKSNDIIDASYSLSVAEQRLLLACLCQLDSREDFDTNLAFEITVEQARDLFYSTKDRRNAYKDLVRATEKIFRREIRITSKDGKQEMLTRWISSAKFNHETMTATLYFHNEIKPFVSQLKDNFTKYRLKHITKLTSVYAIRVYEMIVAWNSQNKSFHEMSVDDFRDTLDLGSKYRQYGQLREYVIESAVKQINKDTNFKLEINGLKTGRVYTKLQFRFNIKEKNEIEEQANFQTNLKKRQGGKKRRIEKAIVEKQKQEWGDLQKTKAEFEAFCSTIKIDVGMKFYSKTLKKTYEVSESNLINSQDFKGQFGFNGQTLFLQNDDIKKLIFMQEFEQIINDDDTETRDIFKNNDV